MNVCDYGVWLAYYIHPECWSLEGELQEYATSQQRQLRLSWIHVSSSLAPATSLLLLQFFCRLPLFSHFTHVSASFPSSSSSSLLTFSLSFSIL
jgi:hypothetical protein